MRAIQVVLTILFAIAPFELALGADPCPSEFSKLTRERVAALITELARLQLDTIQDKDLVPSVHVELVKQYEKKIAHLAEASRLPIDEIRKEVLKEKQRLFFSGAHSSPKTADDKRRAELKQLPGNYVIDRELIAGSEVYSVSFSPDGKSLASGSRDKTVRVWDLTAKKDGPTILKGHEGWVRSVSFSPDGKRLATGSDDGTVRVWNLEAEKDGPRILKGHEDWVRSASFSPDGKSLVSGSHDGIVRVWDLTAEKDNLRILKGHGGCVNSLSFSPDGKSLASGSDDGKVRLWRYITAEEEFAP